MDCRTCVDDAWARGFAGNTTPVYIGTSIFLIALGAILYFAVTATLAGISIQTAGLILMIVGIIGLLVSLFLESAWRDRRRQPPADAPPVVEREYR